MKKLTFCSFILIFFLQGNNTVIANDSAKVVRINFISGIYPNSVGKLIEIISNEMLKGNSDIQLVIQSGGGDVDCAIAAYNYIRGIKINVSTYNISRVGSAANILFATGDKRYAFDRSYFFYHNNTLTINTTTTSEEIDLHVQIQEYIKANSYQIAKIALPNISEEKVKDFYCKTIMITPSEAKEFGLINEIIKELPKADIIYNIN